MSSSFVASLSPSTMQLVATAIFAIAVLHTFSTRILEHLAHIHPRHAGLWHLLGEVEVVFGFWAMVLILLLAVHEGTRGAMSYLENQSFREPAFIFVIMVMAASRPVLDFSTALLLWIARLLPLTPPVAYYVTILSVGPLLGSFITEPAAMTLSAMLLRERYFSKQAPARFKYATIGVLFVNISIGGTLTPFAAPPVLMVVDRWSWDFPFMLQTFGWKAALAVVVNTIGVAALLRNYLKQLPHGLKKTDRLTTPWLVVTVHLILVGGVVLASHHPIAFIGLFLFFLGFAEAYRRYQNALILREGLLVAFFLAGLVVLGGKQEWWLQPLLEGMGPATLYYGATLLTAVTDNAALTYLGSLVDGMSSDAKYSLVAGAVTGGGLTVIANAPNPAGFAILKGTFDEGAISPLWLAIAAAPPTLVAIAAFRLLPG
jgi:hypothetical protein